MAVIHKSVTIEAHTEKVFDVVEAPENWPKYVPHVHEALDIRRSQRRVGDSFRLIYKVLGITFDEKLIVTEFQRPKRGHDIFSSQNPR